MRLRYSDIRENNGFTLIELMIAVSIIGILAAVATPSMQRYFYEAKTAQLLVNIGEIRLLNEETVEIEGLALKSDVSAYKSPSMGKAPPAFSDHDALYNVEGVLLWSQLEQGNYGSNNDVVNIKDKPIARVYAQAKTAHAKKLLHAFDHITKQKHKWIMSDFMIVGLE